MPLEVKGLGQRKQKERMYRHVGGVNFEDLMKLLQHTTSRGPVPSTPRPRHESLTNKPYDGRGWSLRFILGFFRELRLAVDNTAPVVIFNS